MEPMEPRDIVTGAPEAAANEAAQNLFAIAQAIDQTLKQADAAVARAARGLGQIGLQGPRARERLRSLSRELTFAISCSAVDENGTLVSEAPAEFQRVEGMDLRGQAHVRRLLETQRPVLSDVFRAVEGTDTVVLGHPVFDGAQRFLGFVAMVARPASLIGHALKPIFSRRVPDVYVMQKNGYLLYDSDRETIGRNVFEDPMFREFPELIEVLRRQVLERSGADEYRFFGQGLTPPLRKRVIWMTVELHGTEWRVALAQSMERTAVMVPRYREPAVPIPAEVGLNALIAISDGYLRGLLNDLRLIAAEPEVKSGRWEELKEPLRRVSQVNPPGVYFYAEPDGGYWTLERGRGVGSIAQRPYFPRVMAGESIVGELVVGRAMGRFEGVVAIPVRRDDAAVIGLLGATMYLDELSQRIREQLGLGEGIWFYAFDEDQRLALYPDPSRVFLTAGELGPEVETWFAQMQKRGHGEIEYVFEGTPRTLVFRHSTFSGWTYAFGFVGSRGTGAVH